MNAGEIVFIDVEIALNGEKILDIGAIKENGSEFHSKSLKDFSDFLRENKYVCGHNILNHDLKYLENEITGSDAIGDKRHFNVAYRDTICRLNDIYASYAYCYDTCALTSIRLDCFCRIIFCLIFQNLFCLRVLSN